MVLLVLIFTRQIRGSLEYIKDLMQLLGKGGLAKLKEHQA